MVVNRREKKLAREYAVKHGVSYVEALRKIREAKANENPKA